MLPRIRPVHPVTTIRPSEKGFDDAARAGGIIAPQDDKGVDRSSKPKVAIIRYSPK